MKTDWFELRDARLHLAPYTDPHFPIAVASVLTPSGVVAAGRHGLGVLSLGAGLPGGQDMVAKQWRIAEETAEAADGHVQGLLRRVASATSRSPSAISTRRWRRSP